MRPKRYLYGIGGLALALGQAHAADPVVSSYVGSPQGIVLAQAPMPSTPQAPKAAPAPAPAPAPAAAPAQPQAPMTEAFSQAPPAGGEAVASAAPQMLGDSLSYVSASPAAGPPNSVHPVRALAGSAFKIADNESPAPQDRLFLNTDYFTRVDHSLRSAGGAPAPSLRLAREVFGFEKSFLDGDASIEARVPFFQLHDTAGGNVSDFGDLTLVFKYAFVNNHDCHGATVLSGGVALTMPTGPNDVVAGTTINPFIFQPYLGYLLGGEDLYVQGYSSLAIPFSDTVPTVWFNDIGVGYYAWKGDGCLHSIVPTVEGHLTTPFGQIGAHAAPIGVIDTLVLTGGVHLVFAHHSTLTFGYEFPITGPQPFESEYVVQFNWNF